MSDFVSSSAQDTSLLLLSSCPPSVADDGKKALGPADADGHDEADGCQAACCYSSASSSSDSSDGEGEYSDTRAPMAWDGRVEHYEPQSPSAMTVEDPWEMYRPLTPRRGPAGQKDVSAPLQRVWSREGMDSDPITKALKDALCPPRADRGPQSFRFSKYLTALVDVRRLPGPVKPGRVTVRLQSFSVLSPFVHTYYIEEGAQKLFMAMRVGKQEYTRIQVDIRADSVTVPFPIAAGDNPQEEFVETLGRIAILVHTLLLQRYPRCAFGKAALGLLRTIDFAMYETTPEQGQSKEEVEFVMQQYRMLSVSMGGTMFMGLKCLSCTQEFEGCVVSVQLFPAADWFQRVGAVDHEDFISLIQGPHYGLRLCHADYSKGVGVPTVNTDQIIVVMACPPDSRRMNRKVWEFLDYMYQILLHSVDHN